MSATRRAVVVLALAVVVAAGCVVAGVWQWGRHADRSATAALVAANYDADPIPVDQVLDVGADLAAQDAWRPVTVTGRYLTGAAVLRGRPVDGRAAVHDLRLLQVTAGPLAGSSLVVNRGWVALTPGAGLPPVPDPPAGPVDVVVRVRPLEEPDGSPAPGEVRRIAVADVLDSGVAADGPSLGGYGVLVSEDGQPPDGLEPLPRPQVSIGVNLSYAFQWWVFALGALVGGIVLVRRDRADEREGADERDGAAPRPTERAPQGRARRPTAEEEEDALLDSQADRARPHGPATDGSSLGTEARGPR
jgi:cytochrome oxidase assembly protein ShyY1